jgi:hypothetical protein
VESMLAMAWAARSKAVSFSSTASRLPPPPNLLRRWAPARKKSYKLPNGSSKNARNSDARNSRIAQEQYARSRRFAIQRSLFCRFPLPHSGFG